MSFNWGKGIFVFLVIFVSLGIAFMIFAFSQDINLVYDNYYEKGVDYSSQIERKENGAKYQNLIDIKSENKSFVVEFPEKFQADTAGVKIYFYNPKNGKDDVSFYVKGNQKTFIINKKDLKNGRYLAKFTWKNEKKEFFIEKTVIVK